MNTPQVRVADDLNREISIDTVLGADKPLHQLAQDAEFMEQHIEIMITPAANANEPDVVLVNVNGVNQPMPRGQKINVRRKYIEVLARMKQTNYSQRDADYINPERSNELIPRTGLVYPFAVYRDPAGTKGEAWLTAILAERG